MKPIITVLGHSFVENEYCSVHSNGGFIGEGLVSLKSNIDVLVLTTEYGTYRILIESIAGIFYRPATKEELMPRPKDEMGYTI